jgi:8-oxo-dGTP pyrophosphatase MutT (NUDIX family)
MELFTCSCGNCSYTTKNVDTGKDSDYGPYIHNLQRAGTFIYTSSSPRRVLLVQSYNGKWGPPKGKIEEDEVPKECARRETLEETGLNVEITKSGKYLFQKWTIFPVELFSPCEIEPQSDEITGWGWFSVDCLLKNKQFLNHPAKLCLREFLGFRIL